MSETVIRVENVSKLYRLGEVGTGSLAHDFNRWWHKVRGKEDPYLKVGEVNDRTKPAKQARTDGGLLKTDLTTEDTESTEGGAGGNQRSDSAEFSEGHSQAGLQMDSEKLASIRSANDSRASGEQTGSDSESVIIRDIRGKKSSSAPATSYSPLATAPKAQAPSDWVYALKDVSFEVRRGEVLGIIGRNGAGKSTLLKILSRVTTQTTGSIKVKGRIASLLEVGTGFHPELTGRENIFLNGAILGMRKAEIARKFDEIVEFSGCARYIDTPVKRYSSGMYVRLAFAVAAHLEPEILIVDEVLAVGDAEFQKKCLGKMKDVAGHGRTILFVSHNMAAVTKLCKTSILLDQGKVVMIDATEKVLPVYLQFGKDSDGLKTWERSSSDSFAMKEVRIVDQYGKTTGHIDMRQDFRIEVRYAILKPMPRTRIALRFVTPDGIVAFTAADSAHESYDSKPVSVGSYKTVCRVHGNLLNEGAYSLALGADIPLDKSLFYEDGAIVFSIEQTGGVNSRYPEKWPGVVCPKLEWNTTHI